MQCAIKLNKRVEKKPSNHTHLEQQQQPQM